MPHAKPAEIEVKSHSVEEVSHRKSHDAVC